MIWIRDMYETANSCVVMKMVLFLLKVWTSPRHFGSYQRRKLSVTLRNDRYSAVKSSQLSWGRTVQKVCTVRFPVYLRKQCYSMQFDLEKEINENICTSRRMLEIFFLLTFALVTGRVPKMLILKFESKLDTRCQFWAISKVSNYI